MVFVVAKVEYLWWHNKTQWSTDSRTHTLENITASCSEGRV